MAFKIDWAPQARLDLWDLLSYISESNRQAAADFGLAVFEAIERLSKFPESGRMVPEFQDPAIREIIRRPCRIVYRVKRDESLAEIARIWHAARGIPEI
jgi:plasmid stabilization system protein ParE